jgi:hypothetical protein
MGARVTDIQKPPMSPSYKAVFVLSLVMIPISMMFSAALRGGKGGASMAAIWWGFTAWYMYKRDNKGLVSLQWVLIWIQGTVGTLLFLLLILDEDLRNSLDYTPVGVVLTLAVSIPLNYGLLVFFQKQLSPAVAITSTDTPSHNVPSTITDTPSYSAPYRPTDTSPSVIHVTPTPTPATSTPTATTPTPTKAPSTVTNTPSHTDPYQQAGEEILKGNLDPAIWARSLVEGAGNDGAVKAAYVKLRVAQLNAAIEAEVERVRAEVATRAEAARAKAEEEILLQYGISRTGDQFVRNDNGVMRKYYNLEVAVAAERTIQAEAAAEAAQVKVDEENRRTESKTSLEAPILTTSDYAALMRVGYEEAEKMQPWRIYRLGNQYAISYNGIDYTYDKLEDAISRAKRLEGGDADV